MAIDLDSLNPKQLNDLILRAEQRKNDLQREKIGKVREKIVNLAKTEGFSIEELFGAARKQSAGKKVKPKYRNPQAPNETWSGRGKRPRWFVAAIGAGKKEKDLLI
ncbi:H-NS histone family protein [Tahibacter soli]|jgi:DNA-binding protein H-NS|uniref:H-NS histone family protein n=1 Tax=Tahibacter soli TaxID=2983605 RepID=A0A9X3YGN6_9GAMM|nr:H-NS histone family protein [Tahibacter soli]MDC8011132.1 H-NS histone family protein [Tahibacter soli]